MAGGRIINFESLTKIVEAQGWTEELRLIVGNEADTKNFQVTDEVFIQILNQKGLIPGFGGGSGDNPGDTITDIQFDSDLSELTIITDKGTFAINLQQFYKVDTLPERNDLISSIGEDGLIGSQVYVANTSGDSLDPQPKTYRYDGLSVWTIIGEGSGGVTAFDGNRTVTRPGLPAINAGGASITEWANNYFFPAEDPIISLSGGTILEFGATLTSRAVNYSITKKTYGIDNAELIQSSTSFPITIGTTIDEDSDVNGTVQSDTINFTLATPVQPSITTQIQETISGNVTDNQGNTDTASTTFTFRHSAYAGVLSQDGNGNTYTVLADVIANPPTDADIQGLSNKVLTTTNSREYDSIGGGGFTVFAWPTLFGDPSGFFVNGLPNSAFTKVKTASSFTNALGFTQPYDVWVLNNFQNGPSNIVIQ